MTLLKNKKKRTRKCTYTELKDKEVSAESTSCSTNKGLQQLEGVSNHVFVEGACHVACTEWNRLSEISPQLDDLPDDILCVFIEG